MTSPDRSNTSCGEQRVLTPNSCSHLTRQSCVPSPKHDGGVSAHLPESEEREEQPGVHGFVLHGSEEQPFHSVRHDLNEGGGGRNSMKSTRVKRSDEWIMCVCARARTFGGRGVSAMPLTRCTNSLSFSTGFCGYHGFLFSMQLNMLHIHSRG